MNEIEAYKQKKDAILIQAKGELKPFAEELNNFLNDPMFVAWVYLDDDERVDVRRYAEFLLSRREVDDEENEED